MIIKHDARWQTGEIMARMETKIEQCAPSSQNAMQKKYETWGWTLMSAQDVVDNYQSRSFNTIYQNREKYVKLMFQRDKDAPWYTKIVQLENEYIQLGGYNKPELEASLIDILILPLKIRKYIRYKKAMATWEANAPRRKAILQEASQLV
jgi:hypothetical protein